MILNVDILTKIKIFTFVFSALFINWIVFIVIKKRFNLFNFETNKMTILFVLLLYFILFSYITAYFYMYLLGLEIIIKIGIFQQTFRVFFAMMIVVSFDYTFSFYKSAQQYKLQNMSLSKNNIENRYEILKEQMNPHFLFNVLSTLRTMVRENDPNTEEFIIKMSDVYRYILNRDGTDLVLLSDEVEFLKKYIFMLKQRFEDTLEISFDIDIRSRNFKIPPFSLQIAVENCIKHNAISFVNPLIISIYQPNFDSIAVKNNIKNKINKEPSSGIGLKNLMERYELLNINEGVSIYNDNNFFILELKLL
jgi:LytS/YehU family sensor histidine kinase